MNKITTLPQSYQAPTNIEVGDLVAMANSVYIVANTCNNINEPSFASLVNLQTGNRWGNARTIGVTEAWKRGIIDEIVKQQGRVLERGEQINITIE